MSRDTGANRPASDARAGASTQHRLSVSVIVVSWNASGFLRACLQSIRTADPRYIAEVIVVDNASSDGSPEMVEREFPEVILVRAGSNLGFARANNVGMERATGDVFALVNSDALVHERCLENLEQHLRDHPGVGMVAPRVIGSDGSLQKTSRRLPGLWNTFCRTLALDSLLPDAWPFPGYELSVQQHARLHHAQALSGCFCVIRRVAAEDVGGLDEAFFFYGEDLDWCKRLRDAGWKLAYVPQATATHFGGGSSAQAPLRFSIEMLRATLRYWRKHHGNVGCAACWTLLVVHHGSRWLFRVILSLRSAESALAQRPAILRDRACLAWLLLRSETRTALASPTAPTS